MRNEFISLLSWLTNKKAELCCLLVEPNYYSTYPPLGLLKIATLLKGYGHTAELVSPPTLPTFKPDIIFVTSLFTYSWRKVKEATDFYRKVFPKTPLLLGGIYASLMVEHAKEVTRPDYLWQGVIPEAECVCPDYSLVPDWDASIVFSSRGCIRRCPFCVVWKIEPQYEAKSSIAHLIHPEHNKVIFWDNNFLASPYKFNILDFLEKYQNAKGKKVTVDFNQGLDARLVTPPVAEKLSKLKMDLIRLAYDRKEDGKYVYKAIENLVQAGIKRKKILVYMLYNFKDTPADFLERLQNAMRWGTAVYPMRYQPNDTLEKDKYVAPGWDAELLEMIAKARRVLGVNGTFAPYEALIKKFLKAQTLEEAMHLREPKKG